MVPSALGTAGGSTQGLETDKDGSSGSSFLSLQYRIQAMQDELEELQLKEMNLFWEPDVYARFGAASLQDLHKEVAILRSEMNQEQASRIVVNKVPRVPIPCASRSPGHAIANDDRRHHGASDSHASPERHRHLLWELSSLRQHVAQAKLEAEMA